jgi:hypothetical protein
MWRFKRTFIRPLLLALLLVMGPVHAQVVFACAMMDMAVQGECDCCDHENGKACVDSDCDMAVDSGDGPCCEQSVEFSLDDDARTAASGRGTWRSSIPPDSRPVRFRYLSDHAATAYLALFLSDPGFRYDSQIRVRCILICNRL